MGDPNQKPVHVQEEFSLKRYKSMGRATECLQPLVGLNLHLRQEHVGLKSETKQHFSLSGIKTQLYSSSSTGERQIC